MLSTIGNYSLEKGRGRSVVHLLFQNAQNDSDAARAFRKLDKNVQRILADMFVDMSTDAAEKLGTIKAAGMLDKINTTGDGGVRSAISQEAKSPTYEQLVSKDPISVDDKVLLVPATSAIKAKAEETAQIYGNDDVATVPFMDRPYVVQRKSDGTYSVGVIGKGSGGFIANDMSEDGFSSFADASEYAIRWILANDNEFKTKWRKTYAELTTNKTPTDDPDIRYKVSTGDVNTKEDFNYSQLNWAKDAGIITGKDLAIFERTINNEIFRGKKPQTADGEYIIDTGKCLMFTDGDFHNPTLSRVIVFATEYESLIDEAKRRIKEDAENTGDTQISQRVIENIHGPGFAIEYTSPVHGANARKNRRRKGKTGTGSNPGYRAKSLRERLAEEGLAHLLDGDYATDNKLAVREDTSAPALLSKVDEATVTPGQRNNLGKYREQLEKVNAQKAILKQQHKEHQRFLYRTKAPLCKGSWHANSVTEGLLPTEWVAGLSSKGSEGTRLHLLPKGAD